jgi:hypothetical protein
LQDPKITDGMKLGAWKSENLKSRFTFKG